MSMMTVAAARTMAAVAACMSSTTHAATKMPFWPQYPTRTLAILNGEWDFGYLDNVPDAINFDIKNAVFNESMSVPAAFDVAQPGVMGPRGTAFYRRQFDLSPNHKGLLYFAACSFYCRVFVDGQALGDHRAGGYQAFWMHVPASTNHTRELVVLVDNRFNATTAPTHTGGDFYHYSGITRDVILHEVPAETFILQVETFTLSLHGDIKVRVVLGGDTSVSAVNLNLTFDGTSTKAFSQVPVTNGVAVLANVSVPNAKLWSPASPHLHTLTVAINNRADAVQVRFGVRLVTVGSDARVHINGERIKLLGFNRHTMWPDTGSALTLDQVQRDVAILVDVGANYVRGAHYPQDQRFLDLCDEHGIMVWEETLGPGVTVKDLTSPYWMRYQLQAVNEMISASINHPSVIFHAFYNEGPSDNPAACPGYNASASAIRARVGSPPSRLVTWASDTRTNDVCLHIADVVSFNDYPAWYNHPGDIKYPKIFWQTQVDWVKKHFPGPHGGGDGVMCVYEV
ncbi:hypothetical protein PTSG_05914 [Salpingoeca rosetta]|uniref:Beta-glucuronidase n=1 Tax=Salpingoeca rosetta (strain ATCC 50818 / BSB-021) TaxID=946362 RepID=F2UD55_SALR5|nr:uncharacterized protein PTSG_05914 [Salpingoeca rosetta]EGD74550.1 hypothetical protein PTSG_05914 [Salpingoeca rosetta]|eukprot:XP_004992807.1 hypothetical protein PTSG_05914 [Salpingoeca rosetta]